jgi:HEAT repeat protein
MEASGSFLNITPFNQNAPIKVKAMPTQNPILRLRHLAPNFFFSAACAVLIMASSGTVQAAIQEEVSEASESWFSTIFSTYGITFMLIALLTGLVLYKRYNAKKEAEEIKSAGGRGSRNQSEAKNYLAPEDSFPTEPSMLPERRNQPVEAAQVWEKPAEAEASAFGAYRIDQEVSKLVVGKPHRMDVMASRAIDDRRAIEASLIKAIESSETTEDGRRRARQALEEYGFVARQSATMLMGRDAWERSSAARTLGQISAPSSLSFLIEALHDNDSVVRNQAVSSLGSLKMPAAIGALLDIARRHPDIPASLLSETLSSCSVESLGYLDAPSAEPAMLGSGASAHEPADLKKLVSFEDLPWGDDDPELAEALAQIEGADVNARGMIAQRLSMYPVQRSVLALTSMVLSDSEPSIRAAAVSSLGSIDHESVFAPVLLALADEARIVQAAAARTMTSLHFDRADAYVRVMETAPPDLLRQVAQACIKTGIAAQAVDRLASEDRHQAYEAFSLFSLLARANEVGPIINVIENHQDEEARLCAVRVINLAGQAAIAPKLREIVALEGMPENVRTAVLEVLYKLDQDQPPPLDLTPSDNVPLSLHNSP